MNKAALILVAALATACTSTDKKDPPPVTDRSTGATPSQATTTPSKPTTTQSTQPPVSGNPLKDPNSPLSKRSVYFEYDSNVVKDEYRSLLQAHARYMTERRDARIRIEGHADERGSREYNLALGQRRAEAVKRVMTVLGVSEGSIETVSFGEEKPAASGHDEQSYAQNRRGDIRYSGE